MIIVVVFMLSMPIYEGFKTSESMFSFFMGCLVLWIFYGIYFDTSYELTQTKLKYKCGFLKGSVVLEKINEIIVGKTLWAGIKPATAKNGLIIKYDKYNEIYISPDTNNLFIEKILEIKKTIKITRS